METISKRGIGYISHTQREKIQKAMVEMDLINDPNCIKIAVIHHHVLPISHDIKLKIRCHEGDPHIPKLVFCEPSLTHDSRDFMQWLAVNNFSLVLHGHQHKPFIATEHERKKNQKEIIVAGAGSVSKIMDEEGISRENYFNYISISPRDGIQISTYQAYKPPKWGFERIDDWNFPIWHNGISISYGLANILENICNRYKDKGYHPTGTDVRIIDLTEDFGNNTLSVVLREILMAFGILDETDGRTILRYHHKDELTISFLKIFSRYLETGGRGGPKLFDNWLTYPLMKHKHLYSPLIFLANLEKKWHKEVGLADEDICKSKYILYPIFSRQNGELKILLQFHEGWSVYLIPTRKVGVHPNELWVFEHLPFKKQFDKDVYIESMSEECVIKNIAARRMPKPSPTRGQMTLHDFDVHFYSLTGAGTQDLAIRATRWRWFSFQECDNLDHVNLKEPEKTYQYGKDIGIFPNNLDILKYVFDKAENLIENDFLKVHELRKE